MANVCTTRQTLEQCLKIDYDFHRRSTLSYITCRPTETLPTYAALVFGKFGASRSRIHVICVCVHACVCVRQA
jgi:hypothetical protein